MTDNIFAFYSSTQSLINQPTYRLKYIYTHKIKTKNRQKNSVHHVYTVNFIDTFLLMFVYTMSSTSILYLRIF